MTTFKHDAQGFLIGEFIRMNDGILSAQEQGVQVLNRLRSDVSAIARALGAQAKSQARNTRTGPGGQRVAPVAAAAVPAGRSGRSAGGNVVSKQRAPSAAVAGGGRRATATVAVATPRAKNGQFVKGAGKTAAEAAPGEAATPGSGGSGGALSALSSNIGRLTVSLNTAEGLDPTVNAMKEITDVVSPLGRGLFSMFGKAATAQSCSKRSRRIPMLRCHQLLVAR
ncbi:MAG: hypothetical protein EOO27_03160 [Comamonadaceae bacterium]|nr:MAG: hypothetical protein EOO27_03160 [Comamonadaceae bacterium]